MKGIEKIFIAAGLVLIGIGMGVGLGLSSVIDKKKACK